MEGSKSKQNFKGPAALRIQKEEAEGKAEEAIGKALRTKKASKNKLEE